VVTTFHCYCNSLAYSLVTLLFLYCFPLARCGPYFFLLPAKFVLLSLAFFLVRVVALHRFFITIILWPVEKVVLFVLFSPQMSFKSVSFMTDYLCSTSKSSLLRQTSAPALADTGLQAQRTCSLYASCQNNYYEILGQCCIPITLYCQSRRVCFLIKLLFIMLSSRLCVTACLHILCIFLTFVFTVLFPHDWSPLIFFSFSTSLLKLTAHIHHHPCRAVFQVTGLSSWIPISVPNSQCRGAFVTLICLQEQLQHCTDPLIPVTLPRSPCPASDVLHGTGING